MDFRRLKYFIAVAEERNIGRAAQRLHISQPPLTRQIQQLEAELGVVLFIRTSRGVELTNAGMLFLEEARNIQAIVSQAKENTKKAAEGKLGRLDIGIFGSGVFGGIPKILQTFSESNPEVRVVFHTLNKAEQFEALRQKRIAIGFNRMISSAEDVEVQLVIDESMYLAVNKNHPLCKEKNGFVYVLKGLSVTVISSRDTPKFRRPCP